MRSVEKFAASVFLIASLVVGASARADQTDPKLDRLFAVLKAAPTGDAARGVEAEIWQIWGQSNDDKVDSLMSAGAAWLNAGAFDRALAVYDQVVALKPNFAEGWNKRATTLYLLNRFDDSQHDIARVLALEPRHFGALSGLGMCDVQLHRTKDALQALETARSIDPMLSNIDNNIEELRRQIARESI